MWGGAFPALDAWQEVLAELPSDQEGRSAVRNTQAEALLVQS